MVGGVKFRHTHRGKHTHTHTHKHTHTHAHTHTQQQHIHTEHMHTHPHAVMQNLMEKKLFRHSSLQPYAARELVSKLYVVMTNIIMKYDIQIKIHLCMYCQHKSHHHSKPCNTQ